MGIQASAGLLSPTHETASAQWHWVAGMPSLSTVGPPGGGDSSSGFPPFTPVGPWCLHLPRAHPPGCTLLHPGHPSCLLVALQLLPRPTSQFEFTPGDSSDILFIRVPDSVLQSCVLKVPVPPLLPLSPAAPWGSLRATACRNPAYAACLPASAQGDMPSHPRWSVLLNWLERL